MYFLFFMSFDCAIIFFSFDIIFNFSSMMLRNIRLNNLKEILNNSRRRILINVFNICLIILTEFNCFLMICVNFLNLFVISTTSSESNLNSFVFLYLTIHKFELMSTRIFFIATSAQRTSINFKFLLKMTLFVKFTACE